MIYHEKPKLICIEIHKDFWNYTYLKQNQTIVDSAQNLITKYKGISLLEKILKKDFIQTYRMRNVKK